MRLRWLFGVILATSVLFSQDTLTVTLTPAAIVGDATLTVNFNAVAVPSLPTTKIASWTWDYGDGIICSATGSNPWCNLKVTHIYPKVGTYIVKLIVTDSTNAAQTVTSSVTVLNKVLLAQCPSSNLWTSAIAEGLVDGTNFYGLPSWVTALTWTQPNDVIYDTTKNVSSIPLSTWLPAVGVRQDDTYYFCSGLRVEGGVPPYTYTVQNAPPGFSVNAAGNYGGTATKTGFYPNILFCATDAAKTSACLKPRQQQICTLGTSECNGFGQ